MANNSMVVGARHVSDFLEKWSAFLEIIELA